jgi:hypothetical protein
VGDEMNEKERTIGGVYPAEAHGYVEREPTLLVRKINASYGVERLLADSWERGITHAVTDVYHRGVRPMKRSGEVCSAGYYGARRIWRGKGTDGP